MRPVRLFPYCRGYVSRDILYHCWQMVEREGATDRLFYNQRLSAEHTPLSTRGDLVEFVKLFESDIFYRPLLIIIANDTDLAGLFWFDDLVHGNRAFASVFYRRRYWGAFARQASMEALRYGFETFDLDSIWAASPFKTAVNHAKSLGFQMVASIPESVMIDSVPHAIEILRLKKEQLICHP